MQNCIFKKGCLMLQYLVVNTYCKVFRLTLIVMSSENKKNAHLQRHLGPLFIRLNKLDRVSNYPIDVNFHLHKVWTFFIKIQSTKSVPKRTRGWKVPCIMLIKVLFGLNFVSRIFFKSFQTFLEVKIDIIRAVLTPF